MLHNSSNGKLILQLFDDGIIQYISSLHKVFADKLIMAGGHNTSCGLPELIGISILIGQTYCVLILLFSFFGCSDIRHRMLIDIQSYA